MGQVWSSALFELRAVLGADPQGRSVMDRVVLESHFLLDQARRVPATALAPCRRRPAALRRRPRAAIQAAMTARKFCGAAER